MKKVCFNVISIGVCKIWSCWIKCIVKSHRCMRSSVVIDVLPFFFLMDAFILAFKKRSEKIGFLVVLISTNRLACILYILARNCFSSKFFISFARTRIPVRELNLVFIFVGEYVKYFNIEKKRYVYRTIPHNLFNLWIHLVCYAVLSATFYRLCHVHLNDGINRN